MNPKPLKAWLLLASLPLIASGCANAGPRVVEVSNRIYREDIRPADEPIFGRDRAGHFHVTSRLLPVSEQRQEVYVHWTPATVDLVKFEYRQTERPDQVMARSHRPDRRTWTVFEIRGADFVNGGPVSAWRVSLWRNDQLLAEQKSALW